MNPIYLLAVLPLILPFLIVYFKKCITKDNILTAVVIGIGGAILLSLTIYGFTNYHSSDTETLNGFVTTKEIHRFECPMNTSNPCENDYACNCHLVSYSCGSSKAPATCYRTECDTCYDYPWEQNFFIGSSLQGERAYKIRRVDKQGAISPPRWLQAKHGDPVSITHSYTNYILDASDSLFAEDGQSEQKYKSLIPPYPQSIYDYYRMDRLVVVGKVNVNRDVWNKKISEVLTHVGPHKQANIIVVIAQGVDIDFANAVRRAWKGFKKNDIVVFAGVDQTGALTWTRTMSWSKASIVNVKIDSDILETFTGKQLDPVAFTTIVGQDSMEYFQRRPMEEFKYLADEATLSGKQIGWIAFILVVILVASAKISFNLMVNYSGSSSSLKPFNIEQVEYVARNQRLYPPRNSNSKSKFQP